MPTKWINFRELKDQLEFAAVLSHYGVELKIKEGGIQHHGFCPLPTHQGKRKSPSFSVNLEKKIFQCFGCGAKGNILDFATLMEKLDPENKEDVRTTALKLQEQFNAVEGSPAQPATTNKSTVKEKESAPGLPVVVNAPLDFELQKLDPAHPYLASRGLMPETVSYFGLGFCSRGLMQDRIAIPLHDAKGELVGYAGRLVDDDAVGEDKPRYKLPSPREKNGVLYQFHKSLFLYHGHKIAAPVEELMVVEGFTAVWWLWQQGFQNVVGLMGASCSIEQAALIAALAREDGRVWFMPDGDKSGERCAESALPLLATQRFCRWARLPEGKQPTDFNRDDLGRLVGKNVSS